MLTNKRDVIRCWRGRSWVDDGKASRQQLGESGPSTLSDTVFLDSARSSKQHHNPFGFEKYITELLDGVLFPLLRPDIYKVYGIKRPVGFLVHGPAGCGKSLLISTLGETLGIPIIKVDVSTLVGNPNESLEQALKSALQRAKRETSALILFDELDVILGRRDGNKESDRRNSILLSEWLDHLEANTLGCNVVVAGICKSTESLDPCLRRPGRFDKEILIAAPNSEERKTILKGLSQGLNVEDSLDWMNLANLTSGYLGADLVALTSQAVVCMTKRYYSSTLQSQFIAPEVVPQGGPKSGLVEILADFRAQIANSQLAAGLCVDTSDYLAALPKIQASCKREGFTAAPKVKWGDIGALKGVRDQLQMSVIAPIKHPEVYESVGVRSPSGILLWGPPGCGKTLLAKAVACESSASFISVKGPEFLNKFLGESERSLRQVFQRARASAPCVIFFDEIDAVVPRRDTAANENSSRVVNTFLSELDGIDSRGGVFLIAASNRPDVIDPALLRPGRIDKLLLVDVPTSAERPEILRALSKSMPLEESVDLNQVALDPRLEGFTGADIAALVKDAATLCLKRTVFNTSFEEFSLTRTDQTRVKINADDFEMAISGRNPSITRRERDMYSKLSRLYK
ncbi:AAA-domain-containing protein [Ascobolus immersus RN42]|uniref:Peroxisomal ATPase PEX1 n=1 Tax=Ascobolus immersus RN42 TaxID=1160509 RepID=A0A3N4I6R0_ASCIM|nr:AAA-domain-containing protein [Ascobolus immersus RN42]